MACHYHAAMPMALRHRLRRLSSFADYLRLQHALFACCHFSIFFYFRRHYFQLFSFLHFVVFAAADIIFRRSPSLHLRLQVFFRHAFSFSSLMLLFFSAVFFFSHFSFDVYLPPRHALFARSLPSRFRFRCLPRLALPYMCARRTRYAYQCHVRHTKSDAVVRSVCAVRKGRHVQRVRRACVRRCAEKQCHVARKSAAYAPLIFAFSPLYCRRLRFFFFFFLPFSAVAFPSPSPPASDSSSPIACLLPMPV